MDFGVFDGLLSSENNNKNTLISSCDLDLKTKWFGSGGGFCKQGTPVSSPANEGEWRNLKMAKISEDEISRRSNAAQNMLSFSSPYTQTLTFPYCARNNNVAGYGGGGGGPFTPSQWMELEHQALIYKYITANAAIPSNLLIPIKKALETSDFSAYSGAQFRHNTFGWGALRLGFCNSSDPEPGRCRRTDGKKWRCAKDAVADQKYCERHMNRGRHRSRKPVEGQTCHSSKLTTSSTVLRHHSQPVTPNPAATSFQDTMRVVNKANLEATIVPMSSPSSVALKKSQLSEFGVVCFDSLLNPMHKSDAESQNPLHQFMEDSNRAQLSISVSTSTSTTLLTNHSFLRMGLELELGKTTTNRQHGMSWETSIGGPLGEVLNTSPHGPKATTIK